MKQMLPSKRSDTSGTAGALQQVVPVQFMENGCENCPFLAMDGDRERCMDCTTVAFQGMVTVMDPTASWAAKWLHVCKLLPC